MPGIFVISLFISFVSKGLLTPFSQVIMDMKHNHPFGKLDPQSCGISYGHRHGIYIYILCCMCHLFNLVFCHSAGGRFQMLHRRVQILSVADNAQE